MAWLVNEIVRECKECEFVILPGERVWREPKRIGLISIATRRRGVIENTAHYCEECGRIMEYEGQDNGCTVRS